ncbi:MAG: hypothetical protein KAY26_06690 [Acinetobacter sp.]|nr:hypothetical protein [Acinetobacter sp.]
MKKLLVLLLVLGVLWVVKISFDLHQLSVGQDTLMRQQSALEQRNASLNDQLVAINRQVNDVAPVEGNTTSTNTVSAVGGLQPTVLIAQQLDLVEFALQQQQYSFAVDKLNQLNRDIHTYELAPALKASLHQVLIKDQKIVMQFVQANLEQQNKIKAVLDQIDQAIAQEIKTQYTQPEPQPEHSFWRRWIQVESVRQPNAVLMQRAIILKEAQLGLMLAEQQLQKGQYIAFQQELTGVIQTLKQLPDAKTQYFIQRLSELKKIPANTVPALNTRALLG